MKKNKRYLRRKNPVQARSKASVDAILQATIQVLSDVGYEACTTNRIAERAGTSIGTLYEYFPSKDAIFATLIQQADEAAFKFSMEKLNFSEESSPAEILESILKARIDAALLSPEVEASLRLKIPPYIYQEQAQHSYELVSEAFLNFAKLFEDHIRVRNPDYALELGLHVVELTVRHFVSNKPERLKEPEFVQEFTDMMLRYILK